MVEKANLLVSLWICMANSRVGVITIASGVWVELNSDEDGPELLIIFIIGRTNAAVFPDPVWAHAMMSFPAQMMGRAHFWTGVGSLYPLRAMFRWSWSPRFNCAKLSIAFT